MDGSLLKQHTHTHNSWNANGNGIGNGNMSSNRPSSRRSSNRTRFLSVLRNLHVRNLGTNLDKFDATSVWSESIDSTSVRVRSSDANSESDIPSTICQLHRFVINRLSLVENLSTNSDAFSFRSLIICRLFLSLVMVRHSKQPWTRRVVGMVEDFVNYSQLKYNNLN